MNAVHVAAGRVCYECFGGRHAACEGCSCETCADLARARRHSEALSAVDAQRMIDAGLELEEKRVQQRRQTGRAGYGRRIGDVAPTSQGAA